MENTPIPDDLNYLKLDFEQAKAKHLLFKSRLRSILYGADIDETPVASHFECTVGKWIYGHALEDYGHLPEMVAFEKVHAEIHLCARDLLDLYKGGKVEAARVGLDKMEKIADDLINVLNRLEQRLIETPPEEIKNKNYSDILDVNLSELYHLQKANYDLDNRFRQQSKELYKAKERFELVAMATRDAVWDWDLITDQIQWNEGFKELFGYENQQIEPGIESWYNRIHPDDQQRVVRGIHQIIDNGGEMWSDEYRFRKASGDYAFIYDRGYALHDFEGKPNRMVGAMQDITARKKAEEGLIYRKALLEAQNEAIPDAMLIVDAKGQIISCNKHFEILWNIPQHIITSNDDKAALEFAMTQVKDPKAFIDRVNYCYAHPDETAHEEVLFKDGRIIERYGNAVIGEDGREFGWIWYFKDITFKKQSELKLKKSEEHFRLLAESMPQKVWTADSKGSVNYFNKVWIDYTGLSLTELKDWGWKSIIHPDDWNENERRWMNSIQTGQAFEFEHRFLRRDEIYRWHLSRGVPQLDESGDILMWIGTNTDIHDQKTFAEQLERNVMARTKELQLANNSLKKSNEELEQFAFVASHDLQEPLRKIQVFTNILNDHEKYLITGEARTYIDKVDKAARRMSGLINDLLEYSRLSNTQSFEQVDLTRIIKNLIDDYELAIEDTKMSVTYEHLPIVEAAPLQMNQLFYNLIGNSLKFCRKNIQSTITITVKQKAGESFEKQFNLQTGRVYHEIILQDNGIGFSQEYSEKIFTIFQRLHSGNSFFGYGIGLAICKKIVNNHHGVIYAQGKENEGATFVVILPVTQAF
ncbi:MAG: PAS domain-containing protein [Chryseolinea sp.]